MRKIQLSKLKSFYFRSSAYVVAVEAFGWKARYRIAMMMLKIILHIFLYTRSIAVNKRSILRRHTMHMHIFHDTKRNVNATLSQKRLLLLWLLLLDLKIVFMRTIFLLCIAVDDIACIHEIISWHVSFVISFVWDMFNNNLMPVVSPTSPEIKEHFTHAAVFSALI